MTDSLRVDWIYNSNAIEGNSLSLGETAFFLKEGLTSEGKPLKDFLEVKNHQEAILALDDMLKSKRPLSQSFVKELHSILLKGVEHVWVLGKNGQKIKKSVLPGKYKQKPNHVLTLSGKIHYYTEPIKVQEQMDQLFSWFKKERERSVVEKAAIFHYRLVKIHPFDDGNGRLARLLMNLVLMKDGMLPTVIKNESRREYLKVLAGADSGDIAGFVNFIGQQAIDTLEKAVSILKGDEAVEVELITTPGMIDRERMILKRLKKDHWYSLADILKLVRIKRPTLKKDLYRMVKEKKITRTGQGRGTRYADRH